MSKYQLSRFKTSQFYLRAFKTMKSPTINQENISIFNNSNDLDLDDIKYNDDFCNDIEYDNEFCDDIEYDNEI
ncbi:16216_t:CDS:2 [Gigaspora rosea]|nr:16216_t:CDS:2 [Gigaspora rosea]